MNVLKFLTSWKYRYFLRKLQAVKSMILDMEFKRFKLGEEREEVRQAYDQCKAKLLSHETMIKQEREKPADDPSRLPEGDIARHEDEVTRLKVEIQSYEEKLKEQDILVHGSERTNELPNGYAGVNRELDGLRELTGILKDYAKNL